jgi:transcriptional regulator GlxA family with amidase domain
MVNGMGVSFAVMIVFGFTLAQVYAHNFAQSESRLMKSVKIKSTQVTLLILEGSNTLSFAAAVDPLRAANRQSGLPLYRWHFATPRDAPVTLTSGLQIPASPIHKLEKTDLLLIVAGFDLEAQSTPALTASIRRIAGTGATIAGIDGGPWVMARAGVLDGHSATCHWEDMEVFAHEFPQVELINTRFQISDGRLTSAGAAPAIEMMLHLVRTAHGGALAAKIAATFIYDLAAPTTRPQSRRTALPHNALTARAQAMMEAALDTPTPITTLARRLGVSPRALQAQFSLRLGTTPQAHYLSLRLAEAERLVTQTALPLQDVALATGFGSQASFARAFRAAFETSASAMRS